MTGLRTQLRVIVYYASASQVTAADVGPLIQHCPLVPTAILDFMAAFYTQRNAVQTTGKSQHGEQEHSDCDAVLSILKSTFTGNPSVLNAVVQEKHDACEAVENGGGGG